MVKLSSKSGQNPDKFIKRLKMFMNLNLGLKGPTRVPIRVPERHALLLVSVSEFIASRRKRLTDLGSRFGFSIPKLTPGAVSRLKLNSCPGRVGPPYRHIFLKPNPLSRCKSVKSFTKRPHEQNI